MAGKGIDRCNLGPNVLWFAEDVHGVFAGENLSAQRVFGAIADEQNEVLRIAKVVPEMMSDAAGFGHPGGTDDNSRVFQVVELPGNRSFTDVGQVLHAERIFLFAKEPIDGLVEAL